MHNGRMEDPFDFLTGFPSAVDLVIILLLSFNWREEGSERKTDRNAT